MWILILINFHMIFNISRIIKVVHATGIPVVFIMM
jgi:hypothetical protein